MVEGYSLNTKNKDRLIAVSLLLGFLGIVLGIVDAATQKAWLYLASQILCLLGYTSLVEVAIGISNVFRRIRFLHNVQRPVEQLYREHAIVRSNLDQQQDQKRADMLRKESSNIVYLKMPLNTALKNLRVFFPIEFNHIIVPFPEEVVFSSDVVPKSEYELCFRSEMSENAWAEGLDFSDANASITRVVRNYYANGQHNREWLLGVFYRVRGELIANPCSGYRTDFVKEPLVIFKVKAKYKSEA